MAHFPQLQAPLLYGVTSVPMYGARLWVVRGGVRAAWCVGGGECRTAAQLRLARVD